MSLNADKILEELEAVCPRERTPAVKATLRRVQAQIDQNLLPAPAGYACLRKVVSTINTQNLEAGRFEDSLEISQEALKMFEDETLRVTVFMCLDTLGLKKHARQALESGLKVFPSNRVLKKYSQKYEEEGQPAREEILGSSDRLTAPAFPGPLPTVPGLGGAGLTPDHLQSMENMDDSQLNAMFGMAKGMNMKDQYKKMYGKDLSEEEARRMETMMTPQNFKMALGMLKSNPNLLNQLPPGMGAGMPPGFPAPPMPPQPARAPVAHSQSGVAAPPQPQIDPSMAPGMPQFSPNSLLENKDSIKMALRMVKDNPRMIADMMAGMGGGDNRLALLQNMSDRKLKLLANFLYYAAVVILETVSFVRRYKAQLLFLLIACIIYRYFL